MSGKKKATSDAALMLKDILPPVSKAAGVKQTSPTTRPLLVAFFAVLAFVALHAVVDCDFGLFFLPYDDKNHFTNQHIPFPGHFNGQVIWITGASSGIGAALAKDLARGGAKVIITARREAELVALQQAVAAAKVGLHPLTVKPLDVLDQDAMARVYAEIIAEFGAIDTIVLNAGRGQRSLAADFKVSDTRDLFELNFFSYVELVKLSLPAFINRRRGSYVIMSSLAGRLGVPITSSYSGTKWALHGYFDALRAEVASLGIHVLIVCPGPVQSDIVKNIITSDARSARHLEQEKNEKKMTTERCTYLVAKAMALKFDEVWISIQPFLLLTYINVYMPFLGRMLFKRVIGPSRVRAMLTGGDVYDVATILMGGGAGAPGKAEL